VDFDHSATAQDYIGRMQDFLDSRILPAEAEYEAYRNEKGREDHTTGGSVWSSRPFSLR